MEERFENHVRATEKSFNAITSLIQSLEQQNAKVLAKLETLTSNHVPSSVQSDFPSPTKLPMKRTYQCSSSSSRYKASLGPKLDLVREKSNVMFTATTKRRRVPSPPVSPQCSPLSSQEEWETRCFETMKFTMSQSQDFGTESLDANIGALTGENLCTIENTEGTADKSPVQHRHPRRSHRILSQTVNRLLEEAKEGKHK